jgi:nuclease-like protein
MGEQMRIDQGVAGRSARREGERSHERINGKRATRPGIARLFGPSPEEKRLAAREKRWVTGARGEEMLAETLARRCPGVLLLHDRRVPGSRANIDHIAVVPSGVYVIDAKRYRGMIEVRKPLFGEAKLMIAGRDRTKLIHGLEDQVGVVRASLAGLAAEAPVHGCLCFLNPEGLLAESGLPLLKTLTLNGYHLYTPRRLAKRLNKPGPVTPQRCDAIHAQIAQRLRVA